MNAPDQQPTNNPYAAPSSDVVAPSITTPSAGAYELASRWARLGAAIIDSIIAMLIILPIMFVLGVFAFIDPSWSIGFNLFAAIGADSEIMFELVSAVLGFVIGLIVYILVNGHFIRQSSQTIGKKALDIVIANHDNGQPADFNTIVYKREVFYLLSSSIPFIGQFTSLINVAMIFGQEKRCGHDLFAGTIVIKKPAQQA